MAVLGFIGIYIYGHKKLDINQTEKHEKLYLVALPLYQFKEK